MSEGGREGGRNGVREGRKGGWDLDLDLGADLWAHRLPGGMVLPTTLHIGQPCHMMHPQVRDGPLPLVPSGRASRRRQACAVPRKNFLCCGMLRQLGSQTRDNMHNTVGPNQSLSPSGSSVVGLLTYIIAKWRKVLLPICKRSFA